MNFFGHATVAAWDAGASPAFVLGAMLPDFASISGVRAVRAIDEDAIRGVALHHRTDDVFHAAPDFVALTMLVRERLEHGGVERGSARAAAHVGVELLLDGTLVSDARTGDLYVRALAAAAPLLVCARELDTDRFARFLSRARSYGVPFPYTDPRFVAERVAGALSGRPRLALDAAAATTLVRVLGEVTHDVHARAEDLLAEVRRGVRP